MDNATSHSHYDSLQASLSRQFSSGLIGQVSYTWSKCIDDGSVSSGLEQDAFEMTYALDQNYDRGLCTFNPSQAFRINGVYSLPFKGNRVVSGWQVSPIFSATAGLPINMQTGFGGGGQLNMGYIGGERPDYAPGVTSCKVIGKVTEWFDPSCFVLPSSGVLGDVPRDSMIGPGFTNLDFSVIKNTRITERLQTQFRAEFFNITNHPNFAPPMTGVFSGSSRLVSPTDPAAYRPGGSACPGGGALTTDTCYSSNAGQIFATMSNSRQIQFALRFIF
jgi:hypothetical protein